MSHLPPTLLKTWKAGDKLHASDLSHNFAALLGLIETAMVTALQPDPAGVGNEVKLSDHAHRIALLEKLVAMHARQRNERELTPLAYTAAVMEQVRELREPMQEAQDELRRAHAHARSLHDTHERRLQRLEQQPEAATAEEHHALVKRCGDLAEKLTMTLAQTIALRHEVGILHKLALGHDRNANRREYAPMATVAYLLQRITDLEKRLEPAP